MILRLTKKTGRRHAMDVTYRPARPEDLAPGLRVVEQAFNELCVRNGLRPMSFGEPAFQRFTYAEDPTGLWVAEAEGTIVGFACSWMRQRFWYLGHLFIRPDIQARGIGQALMSRTLEQAARTGAENRALITPGYNMASTGLYIRNGLYPREPLYRMVAPAVGLAGRLVPDSDMVATPFDSSPSEHAWLDPLYVLRHDCADSGTGARYDRRRARLEHVMQRALKMIGGAIAAAAGIYGGYVAITYVKLGRVAGKAEGNPLLDQLIPEYDVRHSCPYLKALRCQA
jgi:GNAT superfamily N-acetyltransferase